MPGLTFALSSEFEQSMLILRPGSFENEDDLPLVA